MDLSRKSAVVTGGGTGIGWGIAQALAEHGCRVAIAGRRLEKLEQALGTLPEAQRCALVLCQVQGFSNQDAATVLNVSVHALESLLARARKTLKATLFEGGVWEGDGK